MWLYETSLILHFTKSGYTLYISSFCAISRVIITQVTCTLVATLCQDLGVILAYWKETQLISLTTLVLVPIPSENVEQLLCHISASLLFQLATAYRALADSQTINTFETASVEMVWVTTSRSETAKDTL